MSHQRPLWIILIHLIKDNTWPSGNKDKGAGSITAKRRDKWIQPTPRCPETVSLARSCKEELGLWVLCGMVNKLLLYNAFILGGCEATEATVS